MRIETALARRDRGVVGLRDAISGAKRWGGSSADTEAARHKVLGRVGHKAPQWVRAYLDGYWRALIDATYERELVYGGFIDGTFYSTHSNRPDYYGKHGIEASAYAQEGAVTQRGHYWREWCDKGQPRAWFIG